jgi:hypothetical protein
VTRLYRAVANGNILADVPEGLVAAGIYVPVDDEPEAKVLAPAEALPVEPARDAPLARPEGLLMTTAHVTPPVPARAAPLKQARKAPAKQGRKTPRRR